MVTCKHPCDDRVTGLPNTSQEELAMSTTPTLPTEVLAATGAEATAYLRAGRPYSHRTTMSLEAELAAPTLPMPSGDVDPAGLTGTVWARCELVLRSGDEAAVPLSDVG
jgi:hypothetical protein